MKFIDAKEAKELSMKSADPYNPIYEETLDKELRRIYTKIEHHCSLGKRSFKFYGHVYHDLYEPILKFLRRKGFKIRKCFMFNNPLNDEPYYSSNTNYKSYKISW